MSNGCTSTDSVSTAPIIILGILPRSGTGFLFDLLTAHPDCVSVAPIHEDFLVFHAHRLADYADTVYASWPKRWGVDGAVRDALFAHLGSGLCSFFAEQTDGRRPVTKTPRVDNLDLFFRLMPDACLLILVRDGRAVVESGVKSFGWYRESAIRHWARAAERIRAFDMAQRGSGRRYRIVRYEDLMTNLHDELSRIFEAVGLDPSIYDFEAAKSLPVRGSSSIRDTEAAVHWKPVEKTSAFDPLSRWRHWRNGRHRRFNYLAGKCLEHFGYEPHVPGGNRLMWGAWHRVLDVWWLVARTLGPLYLWMKRRRTDS